MQDAASVQAAIRYAWEWPFRRAFAPPGALIARPMPQADHLIPHPSTIARALRRRIRIVLLCALVLPGAALALSLSQEKQYSASASLLFRDPQLDQKLFGSTFLAPSKDPDREAATNVELVSLGVVAKRTENRLREKRVKGIGSVADEVAVAPKAQSDVVSVTATNPDPATSALLANTFVEEYIALRREADRAKIREAQRLVSSRLSELRPGVRAGPRGRSLSERSEQLQILVSLQTGNAELVEPARPPSSPSSPKVARNTAVGVIFGLILGSALALLLERLDRRIRDPKELEAIFDRPILGAIPDSRSLVRSGSASASLAAREGEAFRMLRANLRYFNIDRDVKSVLVTSAAPGDGKTTVAWNLASAAAGGGSKVLVIEADLRHPQFAAAVGLSPGIGLSTVLAGEAELEEAVQQVPVSEGANGRSPRTIDVLFAGPLPPNPTDLLESERMHDLIDRAEREYEFVVIDTPPTSVVPDAIPLVKRVGGVIVVGRLAKSTRESVTNLRDQLQNLDAPTLGVVVNAIGSDADGYGYGYGYGSSYGPQDGKSASAAKVGA